VVFRKALGWKEMWGNSAIKTEQVGEQGADSLQRAEHFGGCFNRPGRLDTATAFLGPGCRLAARSPSARPHGRPAIAVRHSLAPVTWAAIGYCPLSLMIPIQVIDRFLSGQSRRSFSSPKFA
jgi:hypothetical protein